ncbi:hybrid sensor histidine kinase/response regulator [Sorangium sp. So ce1389]|uniref:hybrid sensor histidine kinase/response regulator n=1 Tax=Sorangium sp. So ce1389 TaxID=3133336 RepID=UPI003F607072
MSQRDDDELFAMFRDEATEALEDLAQVVDRLAAEGAADAARDLAAALRILHNIKGAAHVSGTGGVEQVAHAMEEALIVHRRGGGAVPPWLPPRLRDGMGLISRFLGGEAPLDAARAFAAEAAASAWQEPAQLAPPPSPEPAPPPDPAAVGSAAQRQAGGAQGQAGATTVRIEASRIDKLMHFAGEFMAAQGRSLARHAEIEQCQLELVQIERTATGDLRRALHDVGRSLDRLLESSRQDVHRFGFLIRDWSAAIKRARMLPLSGVVPQWRRTVAETAHALGREVRLVADVGDIEVDRHILDSLRDPMMHLLRNAVDHGIEPPDARVRLGKPRVGTIRVHARAPGMMVEVDVSDDGRGLDPSRIALRAVERRLATPERLARMSAAEVCDLVFLPGFSTAESVSQVSGRGVGLDVVRQRASALGGHARVAEPALGGSTFRLEAPATVVSTRGLLVHTARTAFVLPTAYVARTFRVAASEVQALDGMAAVQDAGGEPLRLRWLSSLMQEARPTDPAKLLVVVVSDGVSRVGLVVERVDSEVESVIKALPWNIPPVPGVAGAMILGTGLVAVVLDVPRLLSAAQGRAPERAETVRAAEALKKRRVLVVDDSLTSRTLERNILVAAGYAVDTANDGEMAWQALQSGSYDLVVSDVQMPRLDGVALTRRIRAHPRHKSLPVILVTSLDRPADVAQGSAAGADEYIVKGRFDQQKLLDAVARLL